MNTQQHAHTPTAGRVLVDALKLHGVDRVFCVPGESYLEVLDALYDAADDIASLFVPCGALWRKC
ncbi:MAG: thiamine pyrophosphate-binding protein [Hydrogenophaga sp.]|nr:thiamine pyrophosphate-binding protein [Hydrogenophaga sp.]MDO9436677.1 thiamine pyrophosphate-binding protein [Hydrogenophaga sp.]